MQPNIEIPGQFYVWGSRNVATAVKDKFVAIIQEANKVDPAKAVEMFARMVVDRFATDVFE